MELECLETQLEGIKSLLSHLQTELSTLERGYREALQSLRYMENNARKDDLTGLLRREAFFEKARDLQRLAWNEGASFAVMMIDLDHFKRINDTFGHPKGDEVLQSVARVLGRFQNMVSTAGRYGGEEFIIVIKGPDELILEQAEWIRAQVEGLAVPEVGRCTVSIGVAIVQDRRDLTEILAQADRALYQAKLQGRNRVRSAA